MATAAKVDYYEVLGVERDADEDEIRGAFHARARDWHPDVALSEDAGAHFRELAEAYSVLSKRESRLLYDRYGYRGRGNQGLDEAVWEGRQQVERGEDVHLSLELKSYEADRGTRRLVAYTVQSRCETCDGHGVIGERDPSCEICSGTGRAQQVANLEVGCSRSGPVQLVEAGRAQRVAAGKPCRLSGASGCSFPLVLSTAHSCASRATATTLGRGRSRVTSSSR
jgi:molecular chaperone DnaJ